MKNSSNPGTGESCRILIWRNGKLGNTIAAIPFILALRKALPQNFIAVVVESLGAELLAHYPDINKIILYNKRREHKGFRAHVKFIRSIRALGFTHSFHIKRFFRNTFLSLLSGIPERLGFSGEGARLLSRVMPYTEDRNIVETNLSLLRLLGIVPPEKMAYRFYSSEADCREASGFLQRNGLVEKKYVTIHCGGETIRKENLSAEFFRDIAIRLHQERELVPVFILAPGDEANVARILDKLSGRTPFVVFDDPRIRVNAEVLRRSALFIGNNSGQAHLAALVATPSIVLYKDNGLTEMFIRKWQPWQDRRDYLIVNASAPTGKSVNLLMRKSGALIKV
jgi:ADP-heptose:LPS heptosyltransferase